MRTNACCDRSAKQADCHTHSAANIWHRLTILLSDRPCLAEVDDLLHIIFKPIIRRRQYRSYSLGPRSGP